MSNLDLWQAATRSGDLAELERLFAENNHKLANIWILAAEHGQIAVLTWAAGLPVSQGGGLDEFRFERVARAAAMKGQVTLLQWLRARPLPPHCINFDTLIRFEIRPAAEINRQIQVLEWLDTLPPQQEAL
jgi:hypothetical protein